MSQGIHEEKRSSRGIAEGQEYPMGKECRKKDSWARNVAIFIYLELKNPGLLKNRAFMERAAVHI